MGAMTTLFTRVVNQFKRLASGLKETPKAAVDDFELEHVLIYHGLVGTSPENQRDFRDVRADIQQAIDANSATQLSIALKLPPLWWSEKLAAIVLELTNKEDNRARLINILLPDDIDDADPNVVPICNTDWRVRANAAGILADLDYKQASQNLGTVLDDTTYDGKISFAHISFALGRLGTEQAKESLLPFLYNEEPWLRVDAARALALWPAAIILPQIADALLAKHLLQDYMCIAVSRQHRPSELLKSNDPLVNQAGLETIIQIIEATSQTFNNDIGFDLDLADCLTLVSNMPSTPRQVRACLALANWLKKNQEQLADNNIDQQIQSILDRFANKSTADAILACLSNSTKNSADELGQMRHAAYLAGKLGIVEAAEKLGAALINQTSITNEAIDALALLKEKQSVPALISLLHKSVNLDERTAQPLSAQPIMEENREAAFTYWTILRALGSLPTKESFAVLLKASSDYAADKRQMAIESLLSAITAEPTLLDGNNATNIIEQALNDPASGVRAVACKAVGQLGLDNLIGKTVNALCQSKEPSIKRQAKISLLQLASKGHSEAVCRAISQKLKTEFDPYQRQDLERLLSSAR